jgi:hypothetical protein
MWGMPGTPLKLTRRQIVGHRRHVGGLDARLTPGRRSLRQAAWAGLQDSMPRAALLSIHARVAGAGPNAWEDSSLVQLWGPRFSVYVVARRDLPVFSLGTLPDDRNGRRRAEELAEALDALLDGKRTTYAQAGDALGIHPNRLRYAAATGRVLIRWDAARQSTVWTVPAPQVDPWDARLELARRHLHIFGPSAPESLGQWSGIGTRPAALALDALDNELTRVRTPIGDAWILANDEPSFRAEPAPAAPARLLPSGDPYFLLQGADRELMVPDAKNRRALWTPRVWPGGVLVDGELAGTWRRADAVVRVQPWRRLTPSQREAVVGEAEAMPLPGLMGQIRVHWED